MLKHLHDCATAFFLVQHTYSSREVFQKSETFKVMLLNEWFKLKEREKLYPHYKRLLSKIDLKVSLLVIIIIIIIIIIIVIIIKIFI